MTDYLPVKPSNYYRIKQLENKLMMLGFNGMAYSDEWNKTAKELNKLKEAKE